MVRLFTQPGLLYRRKSQERTKEESYKASPPVPCLIAMRNDCYWISNSVLLEPLKNLAECSFSLGLR